MTTLFRPERRSEQCILHQERGVHSRLIASPRFILVAGLMSLGLIGMYCRTFLVGDLAAPWLGAIAVMLLAFLALGMVVVGATSKLVGRVRLVDVVVATGAGALAQLLSRHMGLPLLVAGGIAGVIVGIGVLWDGPLDPISAGAGYAGAFVGLLSPSVTQSFWLVIAAAVVCGFLWSLAGPAVWDGIGGRMGLVAFLASWSVYVIADLFGVQRDHSLVPLNMGPVAHWMIVPVGAIGALLTWVVIDRLHAPFVLTSAGLSLVVCLVLSLTKPVPQATLDVAFFGGTFVGGSATHRLPNAAWVGGAGLIYGGLMLHFRGPLTGHVGVMGAAATVACLITAAVEWLVLMPSVNRTAWRVTTRTRSGSP